MTGESPGRADQQGSSGETTEPNETNSAVEASAPTGGRRTLLDELTNPPPPPPPPPPETAEAADRTP